MPPAALIRSLAITGMRALRCWSAELPTTGAASADRQLCVSSKERYRDSVEEEWKEDEVSLYMACLERPECAACAYLTPIPFSRTFFRGVSSPIGQRPLGVSLFLSCSCSALLQDHDPSYVSSEQNLHANRFYIHFFPAALMLGAIALCSSLTCNNVGAAFSTCKITQLHSFLVVQFFLRHHLLPVLHVNLS